MFSEIKIAPEKKFAALKFQLIAPCPLFSLKAKKVFVTLFKNDFFPIKKLKIN